MNELALKEEKETGINKLKADREREIQVLHEIITSRKPGPSYSPVKMLESAIKDYESKYSKGPIFIGRFRRKKNSYGTM
jgi:hypothetical protein